MPPHGLRETRLNANSSRTLRLTVEYDGSAFCGFQFQPGLRTVEGELQTALSRLLRESVKVSAAGRTDAGVHATGQVVSFSTGAEFPFERLALALAGELPRDLSVREAAVVEPRFSARFAALERTYVYAVLARRTRAPLFERYAYRVYYPLDVDAAIAAAGALVGEHDFRSFCGLAPENGVTVRRVHRLSVEARADLIRFEIAAGGFLHRMVRTIVGTLVDCAAGRLPRDAIPGILAARDRRAAGHTAGPSGLYLAGVRYPDGFDSYAEPPIFRWGV
jgi:tRNA pseudouridine38-40 synthase